MKNKAQILAAGVLSEQRPPRCTANKLNLASVTTSAHASGFGVTRVKLSILMVEEPWGVVNLPAPFGAVSDKRIGEIWFDPPGDCPLLAKYRFTSERLSIQLHPGDAQARARRSGRQGRMLVHSRSRTGFDTRDRHGPSARCRQTSSRRIVGRDRRFDGIACPDSGDVLSHTAGNRACDWRRNFADRNPAEKRRYVSALWLWSPPRTAPGRWNRGGTRGSYAAVAANCDTPAKHRAAVGGMLLDCLY